MTNLMREEYYTLLKNLCTVRDMQSLIREVRLENSRIREEHFDMHGKYPEERCLLGLLERDLIRTKKGLDMLKLQEGGNK